MPLDLAAIRSQFPILKTGVYLDNAATAQKPQAVIDAVTQFYKEENANVHRGMHTLAEKATQAYENARKAVQQFINAASPAEIIFTSGTTASINLVAQTWGKENLSDNDAIVLTLLEHHSNITPWLQLQDTNDCAVKWVEIDEQGGVNLAQLDEHLQTDTVKLIAITGQSNVIGTRPPLKEIIQKAHAAGAYVLVDAAQLIGHHPVDVQELDCDFLALSGHKIYGPTGIGVLYGKRALLEDAPPFLTGGGMIREVTQEHFTCADLPMKFEAGTPPIAQAVGLHAAIDWLTQYSWQDIEQHEAMLIQNAYQELEMLDELTILGPDDPTVVSGCLSFTVDGIHPHDLTDIAGQEGVFLRAGHHCTQPLHEFFGIPASTRLSIGLYNSPEDMKEVVPAIQKAIRTFA